MDAAVRMTVMWDDSLLWTVLPNTLIYYIDKFSEVLMEFCGIFQGANHRDIMNPALLMRKYLKNETNRYRLWK